MKQYFYIDSNNQQVGPISEEYLRELVQHGIVSARSNVWAEGLANWFPYNELFPEDVTVELPPSLSEASEGDASPQTIAETQHDKSAESEPDAEAKNVETRSTRPTRVRKLRAGKLYVDLFPKKKQEPSFLRTQLRRIISLSVLCCVAYLVYYVYKNYREDIDSCIAEVLGPKVKGASHDSAREAANRVRNEMREREAAISTLESFGITPDEYEYFMDKAVEENNEDMVKRLLQVGVSPNYYHGTRALLHKAATRGYCTIAVLLLEAGANPNAKVRDEYRGTPLILAAGSGHVQMVRLLLKYGANVDERAAGDLTALHVSAWLGYVHVALALLDAGANINAIEEGGLTALDLARSREHTLVELILMQRAAGSNRHMSNTSTSSPAQSNRQHDTFETAIRDLPADIAQYLREHKRDIEVWHAMVNDRSSSYHSYSEIVGDCVNAINTLRAQYGGRMPNWSLVEVIVNAGITHYR